MGENPRQDTLCFGESDCSFDKESKKIKTSRPASISKVEMIRNGRCPMPRACSVCSHAERPAIDQELADAISYRDIAQHYHVSKSTLVRHALHGTPSAVTVPVRVPVQAPQPCPCMHLDWHALVHDAQQCSEFVQQAQTPEQKLYYMQFFLQRFAALIASAGAMRKV